LLDGGVRTLGGLLLAAALDAAGASADEVVVDGRLHDGLEQAVALRGGGLLAGLAQCGPPGSNLRSGDLLQLQLAEGRCQVQAQAAAVALVTGRACTSFCAAQTEIAASRALR